MPQYIIHSVEVRLKLSVTKLLSKSIFVPLMVLTEQFLHKSERETRRNLVSLRRRQREGSRTSSLPGTVFCYCYCSAALPPSLVAGGLRLFRKSS